VESQTFGVEAPPFWDMGRVSQSKTTLFTRGFRVRTDAGKYVNPVGVTPVT